MKRHYTLAAAALAAIMPSVCAHAEEAPAPEPAGSQTEISQQAPAPSADSNKKKFTFKPAGRILADGALFFPDGHDFADGVALPDIRIGGKASYGDWSAKADIGFGYGKLSLKDIYIQYDLPASVSGFLRLGYFVHQFGYQAATSSSMKCSFEAPIADTFFAATGRNIGLMYVYDKGPFFAGVSAICGTQLTKTANEQGKVSVGGVTRLVWRPVQADGNLVQVGMSAWYQTAFHNQIKDEEGNATGTSAGYFDWSANFPTRVDKVSLLKADVSDARGVVKLSPELILSKDRFALESQFYWMDVNRKHNLNAYTAKGVYGLARILLFGDRSYGYSHADAGLATPGSKTFEAVIGYNYTDASCSKAGIRGGVANDYSVTLNYYINKYMIARLRWSYTQQRDCAFAPDRHVNIIQARIQFKF